jgi:hypothetical protein
MIDKKYISNLEELAYNFRDDSDLCNVECKDCELNKRMQLNKDISISYCEILSVIYNNSK